jgi:hypothetical protein
MRQERLTDPVKDTRRKTSAAQARVQDQMRNRRTAGARGAGQAEDILLQREMRGRNAQVTLQMVARKDPTVMRSTQGAEGNPAPARLRQVLLILKFCLFFASRKVRLGTATGMTHR